MSVLHQWKTFLRLHNPVDSVIDSRSHNLLLKELKKRIRRNQTSQISEVRELIYQSHTLKDTKVIQKVLERCYLQGLFRDHEEIRYFLRAEIKRWPSVNILEILNNTGPRYDIAYKSPKKFNQITFPKKPKRELPSLTEMMKFDQSSDLDISPLEIKGEIDKEDPKLNSMFQKVLKLYHFIHTNSSIHSRNLKNLIAIIPTNLLGKPIASSREKNIIKKKITYVRNIIKAVPPLEYGDSKYLTELLDSFYSPDHEHSNLQKSIRREYKKFLRKTFTINQDFNIQMNKYAYIKALEMDRDDYFKSATIAKPNVN